MAASGEDFIDLCLGRLGIFGCDASFVSGKCLSVSDKVCPRWSPAWCRRINDEGRLLSLILSCEGTLRRNCTSSCMCICENISISLFTFSLDNTEALFTLLMAHSSQAERRHMQPSPCLYARCFVLFSLHCNYLVFPNVNAVFLCFVYKTQAK